MVRPASKNSGFTLIELLVALVIVAVVAALAFFGLRQDNPNQLVNNAAREFLAKARSLQNEARNGADGASVKSLVIPGSSPGCGNPCLLDIVTFYDPVTLALTKTTFKVPTGVNVVSQAGGETTAICFTNPAVTAFDSVRMCFGNGNVGSQCTSNKGFLCNMSYTDPATSFYVDFISRSNQNISKRVFFEGSGMQISRMYVQ